jgi:glycosyltransferase involved in cell wall biosynthesis
MNDLVNSKKIILIGFLSETINGPIPIITKVYVDELQGRYDIIPYYMERQRGKKKLASFNFLNLYYFTKHYASWCFANLKYKPKIVHFPITSFWNMEKSLLFLTTAKLLGAKHTIGHLHGGAFIDFWQNTTYLRRYLALLQFKKLSVFIVLSESWRINITNLIGTEKPKVKVLHNLIDNGFENHFKSYVRNYGAESKVTVLGFNLMDSKKGIFDLLNAVSVLSDKDRFELVVIGHEREPNIYQNASKIIKEKVLSNVTMIKGVWGSEKYAWFEKADILVLPSYIENFPVVVLEAASAGIPVIASKVGALPDVFTDNHDILFIEPGDVLHLSELIDFLITNPDERRRLGSNIKNTFNKNFTGEIVIKQLDAIYQSLL